MVGHAGPRASQQLESEVRAWSQTEQSDRPTSQTVHEPHTITSTNMHGILYTVKGMSNKHFLYIRILK